MMQRIARKVMEDKIVPDCTAEATLMVREEAAKAEVGMLCRSSMVPRLPEESASRYPGRRGRWHTGHSNIHHCASEGSFWTTMGRGFDRMSAGLAIGRESKSYLHGRIAGVAADDAAALHHHCMAVQRDELEPCCACDLCQWLPRSASDMGVRRRVPIASGIGEAKERRRPAPFLDVSRASFLTARLPRMDEKMGRV